MHVVATAGHVDHGKSALVRALTGIEPDRWAEERRRGLTIDLGFAWLHGNGGDSIAFVDVPGHERFVANMLAGVAAVPVVMLVVAADEGWMPQTAEHVEALDALRVRHGLVVVSKSDRADPAPTARDVRERLAGTSLATLPLVAASALTNEGLDGVLATLRAALARVPAPDAEAPVRLWVDRSFTVAGAGTVVTGTLPTGVVRVGDDLEIAPGRTVQVRGLQSLHRDVEAAAGVSRVAVNLRGIPRHELVRGSALTTPSGWTWTSVVDVVGTVGSMPRSLVAHLGSAAVPAQLRRLSSNAARLQLARPLPLHVGDRLLLRDPASRAVAGADVADLVPPRLRRRGAAAQRAAELAVATDAAAELRRRGVATAGELRAAGFVAPPATARLVAGCYVDPGCWERWQLATAEFLATGTGTTLAAVAAAVGVPDIGVARALVESGGRWRVVGTAVQPLERGTGDPTAAVRELMDRLEADPFDAPTREELRALAVETVTSAVALGGIRRLAPDLYVGPDADERALARLEELPQPFTVSSAAQAIGASRRVVVPLLEHLDASRRTRRLPDGTREIVAGRR